MLINCPRCGFQQPKDQYCAQCGVDIEHFKAPRIPFFSKIFKNPFVQLSLLIILSATVGLTIYESKQNSQTGATAFFKSKLQINSSEKSRNQNELPLEGTTDSSQSGMDRAQSESDTDATHDISHTSANEKSLEPSVNKKDARNPASLHSQQLIVTYAEVNRSLLNALFEASQTTGQFMNFKDYAAGILPGIEKRLQNSGIKILHKEIRALGSSKSIQWFYGLKDRRNPNTDIGMTTFFELNELENSNLRGNIEIQRTWREQGTTGNIEIQRKSFPAIFEINSGTGFFLSGIMPLQSFMENEDELTSIDVFKILHSAQFRSGESEFVIFIEFSPVLK
jgi:hypothetical protein